MLRTRESDALILACKETLPGHLSVTFLARGGGERPDSGPEHGQSEVAQAMLFGGRKSRLRALVSPWHTGRIWLYEQKAEQPAKITDFDAQKYRHTFRENFYKAQAATLVSFLVIHTKAAGGSPQCWPLVNAFLDGLDRVDEAAAGSALARFLWRYLDILGLQPALYACVSCGKPLAEHEGGLFSPEENGFLCPDCARRPLSPEGSGCMEAFFLPNEGISYLAAVSSLEAKESRKITLSGETEKILKRFLFFLITLATGESLQDFYFLA
jgi:DNA repair protein RecO (recombination protein O)